MNTSIFLFFKKSIFNCGIKYRVLPCGSVSKMPGNKKNNRRAESPPALSSLKHVPAIPESMSSVQNSNPIELDSCEVVFGKSAPTGIILCFMRVSVRILYYIF